MKLPRFIVKDRALFKHLADKGYQVLERFGFDGGVFAAVPDDGLRADMFEFASLRRGTLRRGAVDDSRRLRQSEELTELENQRRESDEITISSLDDLANALTGGA